MLAPKLFIPSPPDDDPRLRILERQENVVKVNEHSPSQLRDNLETKAWHIASGGDQVTGVDKKNILRIQAAGQLGRLELFDRAFHSFISVFFNE
jgi:hypothetical protein